MVKGKGVLKDSKLKEKAHKGSEKDKDKDKDKDKEEDLGPQVAAPPLVQCDYCGSMMTPAEAMDHLQLCDVYQQMQGITSMSQDAAQAAERQRIAATAAEIEAHSRDLGALAQVKTEECTQVKQEPSESELATSPAPAESPLGGVVDLEGDAHL